MNKRTSAILGILLLATLLIWFFPTLRSMVYQHSYLKNLPPEALEEMDNGANTVALVIDGNTFQLESGEKVRLIGVDIPHQTSKEAKEFLQQLIDGRQVTLGYDVQRKDEFGMTLAYVWPEMESKEVITQSGKRKYVDPLEDEMLNVEIIKKGYGYVMTVPPNVKYQVLFVKLEKEAREQKRGLWK